MKKIEFTKNSRYYVLRSGRIINCIGGKKETLKPNDIGGGYLQVTLCDKGFRKSFLVHRIVAEAFIPKTIEFTQINHKDRNPSNNKVTNLEWVTPSQNVKHSYDSGRKMPSQPGRSYRKLDNTQIEVIKTLKGEIPIKSMATYFKVNRATVRKHL